jgi:hypothetical protein
VQRRRVCDVPLRDLGELPGRGGSRLRSCSCERTQMLRLVHEKCMRPTIHPFSRICASECVCVHGAASRNRFSCALLFPCYLMCARANERSRRRCRFPTSSVQFAFDFWLPDKSSRMSPLLQRYFCFSNIHPTSFPSKSCCERAAAHGFHSGTNTFFGPKSAQSVGVMCFRINAF